MQAVKLLAVVGAPFELHELESGASVLQSLSHSSQQASMRNFPAVMDSRNGHDSLTSNRICLQSEIHGSSKRGC